MNILFYLVSVGTILVAVLAAGCTSPPQGGGAPPGITTTSGVPVNCGFTSCHGLDLACGRDPPQACTAIYQLGDKCRQYAYCSYSGGTCTLVKTAAFDTCKNCVDKCGGSDSAEILLCEEKC